MKTLIALFLTSTALLGQSGQPSQFKIEWDPSPGWQSNRVFLYRATDPTLLSTNMAPWTSVFGVTNHTYPQLANESNWYFYAARNSNINGITPFSNVYATPPAPSWTLNLQISRLLP